MSEIDPEILACFLDEATDSLGQWERAVMDLEANPSKENYDALFRAAHNLKGASRAVGLEAFGGFVHTVEDVIQELKKGERQLTPTIVSILLDSQVLLLEWVDVLRGTPDGRVNTTPIETAITNLRQEPQEVHQAESSQPLGSSPSEPEAPQPEIDELQKLFLEAQKTYETQPNSVQPEQEIKEAPIEVAPITQPSNKSTPPVSASKNATPPRTDETIRIAAQKLDELIQLVGELSIHQSIVGQAFSKSGIEHQAVQNAFFLSQKIVKDLQTKALSLRMQPVQSLFQRLERVVRDVARAQDKKVSIVIEGADVELDKTVIERMGDPLVHILRNAVDHGIETRDEREASGKPPEARLELQALQEAAGVVIRIRDDGRGLNTGKIRKKAIERGIIDANSTISNQEIHQMIFLPSFSTADKITDISGRGVGMDVVMKAVQALRGNIDLQSVEGEGTQFSITLPTSLSILDALVVQVDDSRYAVPMHELNEIIDLKSLRAETTCNQGTMISLRGTVVPLEPLYRFLPLASKKNRSAAQNQTELPALIVRGEGGKLIAFQIDSILGQQPIVIRPLGDKLANLPGFNGCTILSDGEPGMILDLPGIAKTYVNRAERGAR